MSDVAGAFLTTLTYPERIWLRFWRTFFSQPYLMKKPDGSGFPNRFFYDANADPEKRTFQVMLAYDYEDSKTNALPALVIEDAGGAQQLGLTIDARRGDTVLPDRTITRMDQVRFTYVFHCVSKDRGESRMMAAIVTRALTSLKDELKMRGLNHMEPWNVAPTQVLAADSKEVYVDTPVQVTFYTVEGWHTTEAGTGTFEDFDVVMEQNPITSYVNTSWFIELQSVMSFIAMDFSVDLPSASEFVRMAMEIAAPVSRESFIRASFVVAEQPASSQFLRMSWRITVP